MSHGIYGGNGSNNFNNNITIDHNTILSAQVLGIAVGETNGLEITNNIVLKNGSGGSDAGDPGEPRGDRGHDQRQHHPQDARGERHQLGSPPARVGVGLDNLEQQDRLGRHLAEALRRAWPRAPACPIR